MSSRLRRWFVPLGGAAMVFLGAGPASAAVIDPVPITPNQFFTGLVNGQNSEARILVNCDNPRANTGHPVGGQTVQAEQVVVLPDPTIPGGLGFTGSAGRAIDVAIGASDSVTVPLRLRFFHAGATIPTAFVVPCGGTGIVTYTPVPPSTTARAATVKVFFVSQP
jgi:hypothetical protein